MNESSAGIPRYRLRTIRIVLIQSRILTILLLFAHSLSIVVLWRLQIPAWIGGSVTIALLVSAIAYVRRLGLFRRDTRWMEIEIDQAGRVSVTGADGRMQTGPPVVGGWVTPLAAILAFRDEQTNRVVRIPLLPDMLSAEDFRAVRVFIKWRTPTATEGEERPMI